MKKISQNDIQDKWYLVDASNKRIGNVASIVAELLLGKSDPMVRPNLEPRAYVVVINAANIDFTEKRGFSKFYKWYSGFPGGLRNVSLDDQIKKDPTYPLAHAIKGMLPKNKRGNAIYSNLKIFADENHPHEAQQPKAIEVKSYKL